MTNDDVTARALARISVAPPYFALTDLAEIGDGIVSATVPHTAPTAPEVGAIEAAQVARHLAILGSCAAALSRGDDERHHYLATRADYSRMSHAVVKPGEELVAEAVASWIDRRSARALVKLRTESGQDLNLLDCAYTVLKPKMFQRFNPPIDPEALARAEVAADGALRFDISNVELQGRAGVEVDCGPIPASLCAGHFPDYPAAPVAILMGHLCKAAGIGMVRSLGRDDDRYRIESGHVEATGLARAGQHLVLRASYDQPVRGGHRMSGVAEADGEVVGRVSVTMSAHCPDPETQVSALDGHLDDLLDDYEIELGDGAVAVVDDERALAC